MATVESTRPDLPDPCTFDPNEWEILSAFWHPVAYSHDVRVEPVAATLLDEELVIYRTAAGVVVAKDICLHRGSRLTLGRLEGDELVCAYHGWRYGAEGRCTRIPTQPPDRKISPEARLLSFPVIERYGVVWTCLSRSPRHELPELPEAEDPAYRWLNLPPQDWHTSAARQVENFLDVSHFGSVHVGTFGNPDVTEVEPVEVEPTPTGLRYTFPYLARNAAASTLGTSPTVQRLMEYEVWVPFCARLAIKYPEKGEGSEHVIFNCASPVSAKEMRIFMFLARNFEHETPGEEVVAFDTRIVAEDRPVVESQRPEQLPLDLAEELHVQADRMTIAYRKALASLGLGASYSR